MIVRVGKVTNTYPDKGKVKVLYEDRNQTSAEIPMLTFNDEYKMPSIGDGVVTLHMENGSSKAFCLGTYWNVNKLPPGSKYKKDIGGGANIELVDSQVTVYAPSLIFSSDSGTISLEEILDLKERIETLERTVSGGS